MRTWTAQLGLIVVLGMLMSWASPAAAQQVVLVKDGVSQAPIVIYGDTPPWTRRAADELATYIEKTSGARPKIIEGKPDPIPERAIWVGHQPVMDELFPDVDFEFKHPEEVIITANENHLAIAGRDRWQPDGLKVEAEKRTLVGVQQEYGTINAVYTFLQKHLGVRWLWPGELGEDILEQETITFEPFTYRYHPQMRFRANLLSHSSLGKTGYGHSHRWSRLQRLQLGSLGFGGSHAFTDWWERFHESHPEYFALQPDGTRSGFPSPRTAKLCLSNPAVRQQWLKDVEAQLKKNPNKRVFGAAPNDGYNSGHCVCENCRAWDHPDAELRSFHWEGVAQKYVAMSDRHVTFANKCAELLKEKYPDKDYYVSTLAYGHSRPAPIEADPAENVIVASVTGFWSFDMLEGGSPNNTTHGEQITGWAKVTENLFWRPNTGSPAGWRHGLPDVPLQQMADNFKYLADRNVMGISVDSVWEHWGTQGPLYYLMAQLAWNPHQDAQAILDDYYQRGFGPAAESVKAYWELMERTRNTFVDEAGSWNINGHFDELPQYYSAAFFDRAEGLLDKAAQQADGAPDVYGKRVAFVRAGLDYTRLAVEGRAAIERYKESGDADAKATARAKWEQIDQIRQAHPMAVNWAPIGGYRDPLNCDFLPTISPRWRD